MLGAGAQRNPIFANDIEQQLIGAGQDQKMARMLELAGVLDLAKAAWLSPVSDQGVVGWPVAQVGDIGHADVEGAIAAVNAIPGFFSDGQPSMRAPCGADYLIYTVGDRSVGRAALFLGQRQWPTAARARLDEAIDRIRQLIHMIWVMRDEAADDNAAILLQHADELAEQCPFGMMVLDADQRVHLANGPARKLLAKSGVVGLVGNRMVIGQSSDAIRFQVALRSVLMRGNGAGSAERQAMAIEGGGNMPLLLSISRLPLRTGEARACVMITRPGASAESDIRPLAEHFKLTPVEVRVIRNLVKGLSVQDAAHALHLKQQTVRTYLKQIFQKTGTHRQAELVQLMLNGALPALD